MSPVHLKSNPHFFFSVDVCKRSDRLVLLTGCRELHGCRKKPRLCTRVLCEIRNLCVFVGFTKELIELWIDGYVRLVVLGPTQNWRTTGSDEGYQQEAG